MKVEFARQAYRYIRKADRNLRGKIEVEILKIQKDPFLGKQLKGPLKKFYSYKFRVKNVQYRLAYIIENNILIVMIASRENFYRNIL